MKTESFYSNSDPVCAAPTREEINRRVWADAKNFPPLKDGSVIVAIGRVIQTDGCFTSVEPFVAAVRWEKDSSGYEGWHYASTGMVLACSLDDEVMINFWNPFPTEASR